GLLRPPAYFDLGKLELGAKKAGELLDFLWLQIGAPGWLPRGLARCLGKRQGQIERADRLNASMARSSSQARQSRSLRRRRRIYLDLQSGRAKASPALVVASALKPCEATGS